MKKTSLTFLAIALFTSLVLWGQAAPKSHARSTHRAAAKAGHSKLIYPPANREGTVDDYFGTKIPAPYQWMENLDNPAVKDWVESENKLTFSYLDKIPERQWMRDRLTKLWNYEKVGVPRREGGKLFFSKNSGLQNQSVVYEQDSLTAKPRLLLDPNVLSPDGSLALADYVPSPDGQHLAYGLSQGGSDWIVLHVKEIATDHDLSDQVRWIKFSSISWTKDGKGFFYSRYPEPPAGKAISESLKDHTLYYHRLGTDQSADPVIYARPDLPSWIIEGDVSEDGHYLLIALINGTAPTNELFYVDLGDPQHPDVKAPVKALYTKNDAEYAPLGNEGDTLFLRTTLHAPKRKIVAAKLNDPDPAHWHTVVPEGPNVIESSLLAGRNVVVQYLVDAKSELKIFGEDGASKGSVALPGIGSVAGLSGRNDTPELFYGFTSFLYPSTVYRYDFNTNKTGEFAKPHVAFDPSRYETRQVFYHSQDGTRIPMFVTARKGLKLDGQYPTILYSYGGFDISITPSFSPMLPVWLEMGGVYAVANLRGGGEYGEAWHEAGMLSHKQNVFDDFIAAAQYLIQEKYTSPHKLGIQGYSNGGLLVGATITQHPELFGAAYPGAGVLDMLRYQKFSGGNLWEPEYGASDDSKAFQWLRTYSPLQNLKKGTCYPPTLITTADHDDRVVPSHSYKFAAEIQHDQGCGNPVLIRVETQTSHGYMPTDKRIAQTTDIWAFMAYNLGIRQVPKQGSGKKPTP
ncbi:MAG: prolyl oligopeptidase family serine peptidase [Acidobacteriia bacterium]|nr:prolyl oligopeptidase family serine peptidase [Terriglobia bacterium]